MRLTVNKYDKIQSVRGREKKATLVQTAICTPNEKYFVTVKNLTFDYIRFTYTCNHGSFRGRGNL